MGAPISGSLQASSSIGGGEFLQKNLVPFSKNEMAYLEARDFYCRQILEEESVYLNTDGHKTRYTQNLCSRDVDGTHISFYQHIWTHPDNTETQLWDASFFWDAEVDGRQQYFDASYSWANTLFINVTPVVMTVRTPEDWHIKPLTTRDVEQIVDHVIHSAILAGIFS